MFSSSQTIELFYFLHTTHFKSGKSTVFTKAKGKWGGKKLNGTETFFHEVVLVHFDKLKAVVNVSVKGPARVFTLAAELFVEPFTRARVCSCVDLRDAPLTRTLRRNR